MIRIQEAMEYVRFLRNKEELEKIIENRILFNKPKCNVCQFEYKTIDDIYEKLPLITYAIIRKKYLLEKEYVLICNNCRDKAIINLFNDINCGF